MECCKDKKSNWTALDYAIYTRQEDIAEMVAFLVSDKAAYITGQTMMVDGGMGI